MSHRELGCHKAPDQLQDRIKAGGRWRCRKDELGGGGGRTVSMIRSRGFDNHQPMLLSTGREQGGGGPVRSAFRTKRVRRGAPDGDRWIRGSAAR